MSLTHPTRQVAIALYRRLEAEITRQCAERYNLGVLFRCVELRSLFGMPPDGGSAQASLMRIRIRCRNDVEMTIRFRVSKTRKRLFDILCTLEDRNREWATRYLHASRLKQPSQRTPILDPRLLAFLLEEMEDRLGRFSALS
jgi:hypothetical protein